MSSLYQLQEFAKRIPNITGEFGEYMEVRNGHPERVWPAIGQWKNQYELYNKKPLPPDPTISQYRSNVGTEITLEVFSKKVLMDLKKAEKSAAKRANDKLIKTVHKRHMFGAAFASGARSGGCDHYTIDGDTMYANKNKTAICAYRINDRDIAVNTNPETRAPGIDPTVLFGMSANHGIHIWACILGRNSKGGAVFHGVYEYVRDVLRTAQFSQMTARKNEEVYRMAIEHACLYYSRAQKLFKMQKDDDVGHAILREIEDRIDAAIDPEKRQMLNAAAIVGLRLKGKWQIAG